MGKAAIISTKNGKIKGIKEGNVLAWLGVPYAQPPVGELRWKSPQSLKGWEGILDTVQFKNKAVQMVDSRILGEEDCLYLNIWRPNSTERKLPVLVYVHGGGNLIGAGQEFKGDLIAQNTNSIIISINYRLGPMGWFMHECLKTNDPLDDSGNYGLLDIIKSLEWVQENIYSFGGDANNVTLIGLSAGARNILVTLISPLAQGMFHKAIILSGGMTLADPMQGIDFSNNLMNQLVIMDGIAADESQAQAWLNRQTPRKLKSYLMEKCASDFTSLIGKTSIKMDPFPHLFKDGYVIPEEGFELFNSGKYHKVPIILGATASEFAGFMMGDPYWGNSTTDETLFGDQKQLQLYKDAVYYGSKLYAEFNLDKVANILVNVKDQPEVFL
jgi:para-nitrobenzyl esterase